ncbi:MAG: glucosaminidase domain-containing protein [Enterobacterales bacterium]|nr:glucosaminidase domain-containing protein [Enterobacterales bacterium]
MNLIKNLLEMIKKDYTYLVVAIITGLVVLTLLLQHDWQSKMPLKVSDTSDSAIEDRSDKGKSDKAGLSQQESASQTAAPSEQLVIATQQELPDFASIKDVKQKKKQFFAYLRPMIEKSNNKVKYKRALLDSLLDQRNKDSAHGALWQKKLRKLAIEFSVIKSSSQKALTNADIEQLKIRIDIIPSALVLAQAANESAWGTSRFARKANNLFGQWCYTKGCGLVPNQRGKGQVHEVRKFDSVAKSIASYMKNLNTHRAYAELRNIRADLRRRGQTIKAQKLAQGLNHYSERGQAYVDELISMIRYNKLE